MVGSYPSYTLFFLRLSSLLCSGYFFAKFNMTYVLLVMTGLIILRVNVIPL